MIDRTNNTWNKVCIKILFEEFKEFDRGNGIGPAINWLIDQEDTGRSPFHVRRLRDKFRHDLATDYVDRITEQATASYLWPSEQALPIG